MRSGVPLGSMGGGIAFELRADGRFTDSLMYNNGPNAWPSNHWHKLDLNEMMFAIKINDNNGSNNNNNPSDTNCTRVFRTHLNTNAETNGGLQD